MARVTKTTHEAAVDRALAALETMEGVSRIKLHLASTDAQSGGVGNDAIEDLVEAFREFRGRSST